MTNIPRLMLTTHDDERLQVLMTTLIGSRSPLADIVRSKVHTAAIVHPHNVMPDVVTSGCRVRFVVNEGRSEEHVLTWANDKRGYGPKLSLLHPFGIALLGLRTGESISFKTSDQETCTLFVENVVADERLSSLPRAIDFNDIRYQTNFVCLARWEDDGGRPAAMTLPLEEHA